MRPGEQPQVAPSALDPVSISGTYYDVSAANILVSAGQTLRFEHFRGSVAQSGDAVPGSATQLGSTDAAHDLVFKTFVLPRTDLPAPQLQRRASGPTSLLSWTSSPAALGYDVTDAAGNVLWSGTETHAALDLAQGTVVRVRADGPAGATADSDPLTISGVATVISDAANLCDALDGDRFDFVPAGGLSITQTFTAVHDGLLAGADLMVVDQGPFQAVPVAVEDVATGTTLATAALANLFTAAVSGLPPLSPILESSNFVDLSASGAHVSAGQALRLRIGAPDPSGGGTSFEWRSSLDSYPGGEEAGPSGVAGLDLCFKIYVDPAR